MRLLTCLPLLVWAAGAQALTCLPHDVAAVYQDARDSEDRYMVVLGRMGFDATRLPETDMTDQANTPPDTRIPARLTGDALSRAGFIHPYDADIVLNVQCFGPWCAGAQSGDPVLAFVNLDAASPEVTITPCGGFAFARPTPEMTEQVIACHTGGDCTPRKQR
ncbi:hypothetical protein PVW47_16590 [Marinovum sp. SP66]|jgi:hypothetical protein|uniref:hypothetical protein n=1 Tax=Marinovum TaxID=367771 RepID=UPI00237A4FEC|nr:hypothetical protein [Marinovum sp. SP66]MDD9741403.1 hypothetical protein [Marinovum sp. SP66]